MPRDPYTQLVAQEVQGRIPEGTSTDDLHQEPERWYRALISLSEDVNSQLSTLAAEIEDVKSVRHEPDEYRRLMHEIKGKRAGALHFKQKVDARAREVKALATASARVGHDEREAWKRLAVWLVEQFDEDELDGLSDDVPAALREQMDIALDVLHRAEREVASA